MTQQEKIIKVAKFCGVTVEQLMYHLNKCDNIDERLDWVLGVMG